MKIVSELITKDTIAFLDIVNFEDKNGTPWDEETFREFLDYNTGTDGVLYYDNKTGFDSIFLADSQALTTGDDNLITFSGGDLFQDGDLSLLDATGRVTPVQEKDFLIVDFACYFTVPSGTDNYIIVKFVVNGEVFRASTQPFKQANGSVGYIADSFGFHIGVSFAAFGMEIYIETSVDVTIYNKYISVARGHKAIPIV